MCCNFDRVAGNFHVLDAVNAKVESENVIKVRGIYDRTPRTLGGQFCRYFQRIELFEKVAEVADEAFHLFHELLHFCGNSQIFDTLHDLHHSAHNIEHVLHSFCFLGDIARFSQRSFLLDQEDQQLDYFRCASRVCHVVSHLFATLEFLKDLNLLSLGRLEPVVKYSSLVSSAGYALWAAALIWQRNLRENNKKLSEELPIHLSGCLFEATRFSEFSQIFSPFLQIAIQKVGSLAGIIHAWISINRLIGSDIEEIEFEFKQAKIDRKQKADHTFKSRSCSSFSPRHLTCIVCTPTPSGDVNSDNPIE